MRDIKTLKRSLTSPIMKLLRPDRDLYSVLFHNVSKYDLNKAEKCHNKLLKIYKMSHRTIQEANCWYELGIIYQAKVDIDPKKHDLLDNAESCYNKALSIYIKSNCPDQQADCYNCLGFVYSLKHKFDPSKLYLLEKARQYYNKALAIDKKSADLHYQAADHVNIGYVCKEQANMQKAKQHWQMAIELFNQTKDADTEQILKKIQTSVDEIKRF